MGWYLTKQKLQGNYLVLASPATQASPIFIQYNLAYYRGTGGFHPYIGEQLVGGTSGSTGMIVSFDGSNFVLQYLANSEYLDYATGTGAFTVGLTVTGATSGAQGVITGISGATSSGTLTLTPIGAVLFQSGEAITDTSTGSAVASGVQNFFKDSEALKINGNIVAYANGHTTSLGSPIASSPATWLRGVLGGTNYSNVTGIWANEDRWHPPEWSDSSVPMATEFDFEPTVTKMDAITKLNKYFNYLSPVKSDYYDYTLHKSVAFAYPAMYLFPAGNIDSQTGAGLDLPPPVAITYPDPYLEDVSKVSIVGDEKYNKVTVRALTLSATPAQLQAIATTDGVAAGTEKPIEYGPENNNVITVQSDLNTYAANVLAYYQTQILKWTVMFRKRSDFRWGQILLINGYDSLGIPSQSVGTPYDLGYRIIGIKYDYDEAGTKNIVTCTIMPVRQYNAFLTLNRVFPDTTANTRAVIQNELSKTSKTYTGSVILNDAGVVQLLTDSGQVISVQDGNSK
jgi:hypothetical protein